MQTLENFIQWDFKHKRHFICYFRNNVCLRRRWETGYVWEDVEYPCTETQERRCDVTQGYGRYGACRGKRCNSEGMCDVRV